MKKRIIKAIEKNRKLFYIVKCLKNVNNKEFVEKINYFNHDPYILCTEQKGDKHKGKVLYKIEINNKQLGFFAIFKAVLMHMYFAESFNLSPVVSVSEQCPYYELGGIEGVFNPWEYYFDQYDSIKVSDCDSAYRIVTNKELLFSNGLREIKDIDTYNLDDFAISELARVCKKYIKIRADVMSKIMEDMTKAGLKGKVLGVQIRGGDMLNNYNHHPVVPLVTEYISIVKDLISKDGYDIVFLATDDQNMLEALCEALDKKVVFFSDVVRVRDKVPPYMVSSSRKFNNYWCGYEVLRDMVTLSCCDSLVSGLSQVSIAARIYKQSKGDNYDKCVIINKGIN